MTTKKTTSTKIKSSTSPNKKRTTTSSTATKSIDTRILSKCLSVAEGLLRELPTLTEVERTAQRTRFSEERCDSIGTDTQSLAVLRESVDWAVKIHKALTTHGTLIRSYSPRRLAFLLECIVSLAKACTEQAMKQNADSTTKMMLDYAHEQAKRIREEFVATLRHVTGDGDLQARAELARVMGETKTADALAESLGGLASLAKEWLAHHDAVWKIRIEDAGLTPKLVEDAMQAAHALSKATQAKTLGGPMQSRDTPEVNRIEGRVVLELGSVMRAFAEANARNKTIPKLTPGPATRHVLVHKRKEKEGDEPRPNTPETPASN